MRGFLVSDTSNGTSFLIALWLADPLEVVLLATHFACLTPCKAYPWSVTQAPQALHAFYQGLHFHHTLFAFVDTSFRLCFGQYLSVICWHPKLCYVWNASAWLMFCSRVFSDPALASISTSLAIPRMNWSLMYTLDRSFLQLGHIKLQSHSPACSWIMQFWMDSFCIIDEMRSCVPWDLISAWLRPQA